MTEVKVKILSRKPPRPRKFKWVRVDRIKKAQPKTSAVASAAKLAWWLVKPRRASWALASMVAAVVLFGTPHLLVTYRCGGQRCDECRYIGVQGMRSHLGPNWTCPVFTMLPVDWAALQRQLFK